MFTISREGVQDANRDGLLGANRSNSLAIARICNNADRPIPRLHTRVEIVNTLLSRKLRAQSSERTQRTISDAGKAPDKRASSRPCWNKIMVGMLLI